MFDIVLTELSNPGAYPNAYKEFLWLQRLLAWLALKKNPVDLEYEMTKHYKQRSKDYYHRIGCYMLGFISRDDLLKIVNSPKQRCEFSYYIGLSERLKTRFSEATNWYHLCRETLQHNNGEFHWASDELFWWAHMGTRNRHRLPGDDILAYHTQRNNF